MTPPPVDYRQVAHEILGERRFHPPPLPRPLHGALEALGSAFAPIGDAIDSAFSALAGLLPGGSATLLAVLGASVVAVAAVAARSMTGRTLGEHAARGGRPDAGPGAPDARALERAADTAEREGRFEQAVRLRFQAGLLRLDELGVLAYRPSLATAAVSRRLRSPGFDALARRFEEVAYGGREAGPADAGEAREGWQGVLGEARRR